MTSTSATYLSPKGRWLCAKCNRAITKSFERTKQDFDWYGIVYWQLAGMGHALKDKLEEFPQERTPLATAKKYAREKSRATRDRVELWRSSWSGRGRKLIAVYYDGSYLSRSKHA